MKEAYSKPISEIENFSAVDVITTSLNPDLEEGQGTVFSYSPFAD